MTARRCRCPASEVERVVHTARAPIWPRGCSVSRRLISPPPPLVRCVSRDLDPEADQVAQLPEVRITMMIQEYQPEADSGRSCSLGEADAGSLDAVGAADCFGERGLLSRR